MVDLAEPRPALDVPGAEVVRVEGARQWLRFSSDDHTAAAVLATVAEQAPVRDLAVQEAPIEEVVRRIYAGVTSPAGPVPPPPPAGHPGGSA